MKKKEAGIGPEVCSGTYFPWRGRPQKEYYVVVDEIVVAGPFRTKRSATKHLTALPDKAIANTLAARPKAPAHLDPSCVRTIESVLRQQKKALRVARGAGA
jgi:hypothetical protein